MTRSEDDLERARSLLRSADTVVILTGAGVSAESGVPTFRGDDGLWKQFRPEQLANPDAFRRDPRLVWEWYAWRREKVAACDPNPAHHALARFTLGRDRTRIVTQNVDDLHLRAARALVTEEGETSPAAESHDPAPPLQLHGSLFHVRCTRCNQRHEYRDPVDAESQDALPRCQRCDSLLRPDVVWFGESLDPRILETAGRWCRAADVALVVGTSSVVEPAASLPRHTTRSGGALIEVNPEETPLTTLADVSLHARAGEVVPGLLGGLVE